MKPIRRSSVRTQVFEQLKEQIINGTWAPGTKIPSENELTKILEVSRVTVREALQKLITLGLLEARQGEGTYVRELSADFYMNPLVPLLLLDRPQIMHVLEYRRIIEIGAMELVVHRATEEDILRLETILENMERNKDNIEKFGQKDLSFHLALMEITRNPVIIKVNHIIKDVLNTSMAHIVGCLGTHDGLYYHEKIIKAIKDGDKQGARDLMEEHIERTIERMSGCERP